MVGQMAIEHWGIDPARVVLENRSTNCAENATLARMKLERLGSRLGTLLLLQDPTMQRRTHASFRQAFRDLPDTVLVNFPTLVPRVLAQGGALRFDDLEPESLWPMERFVSLVMGEIPRLRDDERGYGPKGRGFIPHVEIPPEVEAAHARLLRALGKMERG